MFLDYIDTTFRDGQQSPLLFDTHVYRFSLAHKRTIIKGLIQLGVSHFELFAPTVSAHEAKENVALMRYARALTQRPLTFLAHCRLHQADIDSSLENGFDGLNIYIGASQKAQDYSHRMNLDTIIQYVQLILSKLRSEHPSLYMRLSAEDIFRTELEQVFRLYDAAAPFVQTFGAPDTVGIATPELVHASIRSIKNRYPKHQIECHFHNDRGLAVVNAISAIKSGVEYVDTSVWGIAERSGIPSITALLFNLAHEDASFFQRYDTTQSYPLNVLMGSILKMHVPYTEPISLTNRTHTAGVHQKAVMNKPDLYEAHQLERWGVEQNQLLLGPLSGWNLIYYYLKEIGNYELTETDAKSIANQFKSLVLSMGKSNQPSTILYKIAQQYKLKKNTVPTRYASERFENLANSY